VLTQVREVGHQQWVTL